MYADTGPGGVRGLYLQVVPSDARSWLFRFASPELRSEDGRRGKTRAMGLGGIRDVSLSEARERAASARKELAAGI
jgi:hypothetical protein